MGSGVGRIADWVWGEGAEGGRKGREVTSIFLVKSGWSHHLRRDGGGGSREPRT